MAPRELPILLGLSLGVSSCAFSQVVTIHLEPRALAFLGASRLWPLLLGALLLGVFALATRARRRQLLAQGLLLDAPPERETYRANERERSRARANVTIFAERRRCALAFLVCCLLATLVHQAPPFWSAWLAFLATAGALIFVRFGDGAEWALALPAVAAFSYATTGNPLVGVPQLLLFLPCWLAARWEERRDPSAGWGERGW